MSIRQIVTAFSLSLSVAVIACGQAAAPPAAKPAPAQPTATPAAAPPAGQPAGVQRKPAPVPPIKVEPAEADFGVCKPHEKKPITFTLTNTSAAPLTITKSAPSCKCTDLEDLTGKIIKPGESLSFSPSMKMPPAPGTKKAEVFITFDGFEVPAIARMKALIRLPVAAEPDHLNAVVDRKTGTTATSGVLTIKSGDAKPFRILSSNLSAPVYEGFDPEKDGSSNTYKLKWDLASTPCEKIPQWWIIETDHPECPILPCEVWHDCAGAKSDPTMNQRGWIVKDRIVNLGLTKAGEEHTVEIDLGTTRDGKIRPITAVVSTSPEITASLVEFKDTGGKSGTVKFKLVGTPAANGLFYAFVKLQSSTGEARLPIVGKVAK